MRREDYDLLDIKIRQPTVVTSVQREEAFKNANVIIVDDIIDTGGTICKAAEIILDKGAKSVMAICTHPVLSGDAYKTVEDSALTELIVTDTIATVKSSPKIKVLSTADLFSRAIANVNEHGSISDLFKIE